MRRYSGAGLAPECTFVFGAHTSNTHSLIVGESSAGKSVLMSVASLTTGLNRDNQNAQWRQVLVSAGYSRLQQHEGHGNETMQ